MAAVLIILMMFASFHVWLTRSDLKDAFLRVYKTGQTKLEMTLSHPDRVRRYEEESLKLRVYVVGLLQQVVLQVVFIVIVMIFLYNQATPAKSLSYTLFSAVNGYLFHAGIKAGILEFKTKDDFRRLKVLVVGHFVLLFCATFSAHADMLQFLEGVYGLTLMLAAIVLFVFSLSVPAYVSGALVTAYRHWCLRSHFDLAPAIPISCMLLNVFGVFSIGAIYCIQSHVLFNVDSAITSSFLQGFRKVLHGTSDGGVVLDGNYCIQDASSLEQLLKSRKKLTNSSFLDLLLDTESRQSFVEFLQRGHSPGTVPPGLKISLQGLEGPVSVDFFVSRCEVGTDTYYLCAMKEEPGQFRAPPEADMKLGAPARSAQSAQTFSRASREVAIKELEQVAILVNPETPGMDIKEVTLSFLRQSPLDVMPTLQQFVKVNDWERLQDVLEAASKIEEEERPEVKSSATMIRIPGRPKSYLRAGEVSVAAAEEGGGIKSFWVRLSHFTKSCSREGDLESISEEPDP